MKAVIIAVLLFTIGCGEGSTPIDAAIDGMPDASSDAMVDAMIDASLDASLDAGFDATDARLDAIDAAVIYYCYFNSQCPEEDCCDDRGICVPGDRGAFGLCFPAFAPP